MSDDGGRAMARDVILAQRKRISELEGVLIRLTALLYAYNAEKPDKKIVELAEVAREAAGEAVY